MPKKDKLLRIDQAAEILNCCNRHVRYLCAEAHLVSFKIGKNRGLRIVEQSVYDYIDRQKNRADLLNGIRAEK